MHLYFIQCVFFFVTVECCGDYYWRDYNGTVPHDAIPISNTELFYIGQAYVHNHGLFTGTIVPGKTEVSIGYYGVTTVDVIIKILCAQKKTKYYWIETSDDNYIKNITNKCPVIGGYDQKFAENGAIKLGTLHIGRYFYAGSAVVGNINYFGSNPKPRLYFTLEGFSDRELSSPKFEALIYSEYPIIPYRNKIPFF